MNEDTTDTMRPPTPEPEPEPVDARLERAFMFARRQALRDVVAHCDGLGRLVAGREMSGVMLVRVWAEQRANVLTKALEKARREGTGFPVTLDDDLPEPATAPDTPRSETDA